MRLEGADCAFGDGTEMDIRGNELELRPPILFNVELVSCTAFVVKDLEVDTMAAICKTGHDSICGVEAVTVVAGFEWIQQDDIGVHMVGEHEEVVDTLGANLETAHVISVNFADRFGRDVELL